jgi:hypothetical protein
MSEYVYWYMQEIDKKYIGHFSLSGWMCIPTPGGQKAAG